MQQHDLDRAVSRATGESVATVAAMGFSLFVVPPRPHDRRVFSRHRTKGKEREQRARRPRPLRIVPRPGQAIPLPPVPGGPDRA